MATKPNVIPWVYLGLFVLVLAGAAVTFRIRYSVCQVCGLQRYERSVYGIALWAASSARVDPDGHAAAWEKANGGPCTHVWVTQEHSLFSTPVAAPRLAAEPPGAAAPSTTAVVPATPGTVEPATP